ncbi:MAG: hypothetical protein WD696_16520 [Bryobacteraceae bacterium]
MASYISSSANRLYTAAENLLGQIPSITAQNRFPAVRLAARQQLESVQRRDKTGTRTFAGVPFGVRRRTTFDLTTYLTSWTDSSAEPCYGALFRASLGGNPRVFPGGIAAGASSALAVSFVSPHSLQEGQAVTYAGELRFVASVIDSTRIQLNAPFSTPVSGGSSIGPTITYVPATDLQSASIFDYWSPSSAVQRILCGAAVNRMLIRINGDFHEFEFSGIAQDLVDSSSFVAGLGQLTEFPEEPSLGAFDHSLIPGHMGQAWLGSGPDRFFTITSGTFALENNLDVRAREFGSNLIRSIVPGQRSVSVDFDLYGQDDTATKALYQAARQQSPMPVMFQLGQQSGQLFGIYLKSVVPEVPDYDDSDARLQWRFRNSRAQGTVDDEIAVAFG